MEFREELQNVLPADLPNRDAVISTCALHLERISDTNRHFNLTRIVSPREAAIKHVFDSVAPWRHFAGAAEVLDAGTGAGFPGIPLAVALPGTKFTLADSTQKKARFVEETARALGLANVAVVSSRAEDLLKARRFDVLTARAMAPLPKALSFFAGGLAKGSRALLYKGPDAEEEIADSAGELKRLKVRARVIGRYDLPDEMGTRVLVEIGR